MNIVTIKEVKGVVKCADDGTAEQVFNVKNATDKTLKVGLQISTSEPTETEWLSIDGPAERELEVETMTQITVKIQVAPDCAAGKYSYRLRVFDPQNPGERFTDGETVYFEVPERVPEPTPKAPKKKIKWWIAAAIAAGVIVVGVVVWLLWPELPNFIGMDLEKAKGYLENKKIDYEIKPYADPPPTTKIRTQKPDPGTKLKAGVKVILTFTDDRVELPDFTQMDLEKAKGYLENKKIDYEIKPYADPPPTTKIRTQKPDPGTKLKAGVKVILTFTDDRVELPDFTQMDLKSAKGYLENKKIDYEIKPYADPPPTTKIREQKPDPGTKLKAGVKVILMVEERPSPPSPPIIINQ